MRFRHVDPKPVLAFLAANPTDIRVREWERERIVGGIVGMIRMGTKPQSAAPAQPAKISDVEFIAGRGKGPAHAGTVLRFYFHINSSAEERILPLVEAVAHIEGRGAAGEFLLAGHPDGGLISVSRERLPFQQGDPITWWGP
jgi:hypothetical protein